MAREASITQEQVNAAADAIRAGGAKPTARAIRDHLGTGSMATVLKLLQVWQSGQVKPAAQDVTLPPALTRALVDFIGQEVATAKAGLESDLVTAQQAQADMIAESERQAGTIEAQAEVIEGLQSDKASLVGKLGQLEADLSGVKEEAASERQAAENARTELAKAQLRLEAMPRLEADLDAIRAELAQERAARVAAEQKAAVLGAEKTAIQGKAEYLQTRLAKAEKDLSAAAERAQELNQDLTNTKVQVQACQARLEAAARDLEASEKSVTRARDAERKSSDEAAELRGVVVRMEKQLGERGRGLEIRRKNKSPGTTGS